MPRPALVIVIDQIARPCLGVFGLDARDIVEQCHSAAQRDGVVRYRRNRRGIHFPVGAARSFDMGNPSGIIPGNLPIRIIIQGADNAGLATFIRDGGLYFILTKIVRPVLIRQGGAA